MTSLMVMLPVAFVGCGSGDEPTPYVPNEAGKDAPPLKVATPTTKSKRPQSVGLQTAD